jgi:hypothetical protein
MFPLAPTTFVFSRSVVLSMAKPIKVKTLVATRKKAHIKYKVFFYCERFAFVGDRAA